MQEKLVLDGLMYVQQCQVMPYKTIPSALLFYEFFTLLVPRYSKNRGQARSWEFQREKIGQIGPLMSCFRSSFCFYRYLFSYYPAALIKLPLNTACMSKRLCVGFPKLRVFWWSFAHEISRGQRPLRPAQKTLYCPNAF